MDGNDDDDDDAVKNWRISVREESRSRIYTHLIVFREVYKYATYALYALLKY